MNIEEIRADVFRLFDIRVDKDDPIWAFLYANREIIRDLEDIIELNKKENKEYHRNLKVELELFKETSHKSVQKSIEQFDFRIDEFHSDIRRIEAHHEDVINYHVRFKKDISKSCESRLEQMSGLFDSNIIALEDRVNSIVEAVDYTRFATNIEREVETIVRKSLQEVRAGVSMNNRAMDNLKDLNEHNILTIRRLDSQVSRMTTLGTIQTILFGASLTFLSLIYFSQGNLKFPSVDEVEKKIERSFANGQADER